MPPDVVERAKHLLLDGIGCALIGSQLPWSRVATGAVLDLENKGDVVVIGTGQSTSGPAAAVLNGTFIQGFELDDFHPIAPLHSCSLVIPALLSTATAQSAATTGADFLLGAITGFEVGPARRLRAARHPDARPRLALGTGLRHALRGNGIRQTARRSRRHSWRMRWAWRAPSRRG